MIPQPPRGVLYLVIGTLCILTLELYTAGIALMAYGKGVPGELWLAAGGSSGGLLGLLGVAHATKPTQDVQVVNDVSDPVPVDSGSARDDEGLTAIEALVVIALILLIAILLGHHPRL